MVNLKNVTTWTENRYKSQTPYIHGHNRMHKQNFSTQKKKTQKKNGEKNSM